ncbi:MAG: phasin family protein [Pseudomonadota bacterium]
MAKGNGKSKTGTKDFEATGATPAEAMKRGMEQFMSFGGDFSEMNRSGLQAIAESAKAAGKGIEAMSSQNLNFVKSSMERNVEAAKAMANITSMEEAAEAQAKFVKDSFKAYIGQMNEMASLWVSTMRDTAEPLNAQGSSLVEKFQTKA